MSPIKTFVFLDLETTGLPHLEHNLTRITELCAVAVQADHIELGCFPRVHNKMSFCFNPQKLIAPESTDLTGLSNNLLEKQSCFTSDVVDIIKKWLDMCQKPVCLVAHNGNRFDYPIFRAEIEKTGNSISEDVLCIDSICAFRELDKIKETVQKPPKEVKPPKELPFEFDDDFDEILSQACDEFENMTPSQAQKSNETTPKKQMISSEYPNTSNKNGHFVTAKRNFSKQFVSYKLGDIYTRLTNKPPVNSHEAEGDVVMLITCAAVYGEKFVDYANGKSVKFSEIPMMKPGRRVGM